MNDALITSIRKLRLSGLLQSLENRIPLDSVNDSRQGLGSVHDQSVRLPAEAGDRRRKIVHMKESRQSCPLISSARQDQVSGKSCQTMIPWRSQSS